MHTDCQVSEIRKGLRNPQSEPSIVDETRPDMGIALIWACHDADRFDTCRCFMEFHQRLFGTLGALNLRAVNNDVAMGLLEAPKMYV